MSDPFNGPLHEMALTTPTGYWNDSCSIDELNYAIARGATGATSNPSIVLNVLKKELPRWLGRIQQVISENPSWSEIQVGWQIYEELAVAGANLMLPVFEREQHKRGRLSIQTDPALYRDSAGILAQSECFSSLTPNMQVKIPATNAGIAMVEEATYRGVNLNVTVSFTVPQVLAVGEAVERGLKRRAAEGLDTSSMSPVATLMVGRTDDWLKVLAKRDAIEINPEYLEWPGVICFKHAYALYQERGYHTLLLVAAYRNFYHWTEFIGGDVAMTIPHEWQVKFNESDTRVVPRMQIPVQEEIVDELYRKFPDFRRAYDVNGMTPAEFDTFGATVRTLRTFTSAWHDFIALIRDFMLPDPDIKHE